MKQGLAQARSTHSSDRNRFAAVSEADTVLIQGFPSETNCSQSTFKPPAPFISTRGLFEPGRIYLMDPRRSLMDDLPF
jgi:hypothetical protein